jgi:glycine oxidase
MTASKAGSVAVVGGGIIGLSIAWQLRQRDVDVVVFDDGEPGAWHVAAGMLAPGGESTREPEPLTRLLTASNELWPEFAASLGVDVGYDDAGTLSLAMTADDVAAQNWDRPLRPTELRELEPALSPRVRAGVYSATDRQVDPRRVVAALRARLAGRIVNRSVSSLSEVDAPTVVVAAGCGTAALTGLPVRPVKGQVLRLRGEPGLIRHVLHAPDVYVVPRRDGEIVVGATQEERTDRVVTAGGVHELLRSAISLVPALAECALVETGVGFRPGTPDNAPMLGRLPSDPRVVVAAGHFRNGILLAPVTARLIADPTADTSDFAPGRFS